MQRPLNPTSAAPTPVVHPVVEPLEHRTLMSGNLLANPNFTRGAVGFATGLAKGGLSLESADTYVVGTNPHLYHLGGASFGDHTTGTGKMLLVNGSGVANTTIWRETVKVVPHVAYSFTGWSSSWATNGPDGGDISPADVEILINGKPVFSVTLPTTDGQWTPLDTSWLATAGRATITITDLNLASSGNDSAYDDFSFTPLASIRGAVVSDKIVRRSAHLAGIAGVTVYLDSNDNGILDPGELTTITTRTGAYTFTGLTAGTYVVRQTDAPTSLGTTSLLSTGQLILNLTPGHQAARQNLWDIYTAVIPTDIFR